MERYKCRFCFKSFINGRALGGHMRSHMLCLSAKRELSDLSCVEEEEERPSQLSDDDTELDASSSSGEEEYHGNCGEFDDLKRNRIKMVDDELEFDLDLKKLKTSQRDESVTEPEHHSSASDATTEEDLAFCLIMLSRDKWKQQKKKRTKTGHECEDYKFSKYREGRGRFKCESCGKVFKSYQALGGHRASHKKNKTCTSKTEQVKTEYEHGVTEKKIHECSICFRVFTSGQALGGHKRSHGSSMGGRLSVNQTVQIGKEEEEVSVQQRMIDLNLPAPTEDDETSSAFYEW